jgi:succinate dehydrogenase/fumarate reductase cytochrome b subunit
MQVKTVTNPSADKPPIQDARQRRMKRALVTVQRWSAAYFAVFLTIHLVTVLGSLGGAERFDALLGLSRLLYGHLPVELFLLAAVLAHMGASVRLWWQRPAGSSRPWGPTLHTFAGFLLVAFIGGHVLFTRILPEVAGFVPDFGYIRIALSIWPTFFVPYYALLGAAGAYHLLYGIAILLRKPPRRRWPLFAAAAVIFTWVPVAMLREPVEYSDLQISQYLAPYELATPWLLEAASLHPHVKRYRSMADPSEPGSSSRP